jgi:acetyl/propionyl-CoA carboxylase alpha subunit
VLAARAVNYVGAGTIEFIADASEGLRGDRIWFMEMNTRLQVEHPVTEEITGQDLVEWQLRVASGEKLPLKQEELKINGWAMEARLYAENPETGFLPSIGRLMKLDLPEKLARVDTGVTHFDEVSPNYDPMIAKIITHGPTRQNAIDRLRRACETIEVYPVKTNAGFLVRCLEDSEFVRGAVDTNLIAARGDTLSKRSAPDDQLFATAVAALLTFAGPSGRRVSTRGPWAMGGFRVNAADNRTFRIKIDGAPIVGEPSEAFDKNGWSWDGEHVRIFQRGDVYEVEWDTGERSADEASAGDGAILSPMPGKIVSVAAKAGAKLKKGDPILVLEAMKMEHTLTAPFDGKVVELTGKAGDQVAEGVVLAKIEAA